MCGRYNVVDNPALRELCQRLGLTLFPDTRLDVRPGGMGNIILVEDDAHQLADAYWSLLIEPKPHGVGYRPVPKYHTFNARSDRLNSSRLWRRAYARQRALVPFTGWHEWLDKRCYLFTPQEPLMFGGLYERWRFGDRSLVSYTIVTVPSHPRLQAFHDKSLPLLLTRDDFDAWLDPAFAAVDAFADLMRPRLPCALSVTPVVSPLDLSALDSSETVTAD